MNMNTIAAVRSDIEHAREYFDANRTAFVGPIRNAIDAELHSAAEVLRTKTARDWRIRTARHRLDNALDWMINFCTA